MARISGRTDAGPPRPTGPERAAKRALLRDMDDVGWFRRGSLLRVFNRCGAPGCGCHTDSSKRHGPYWQWTRKVAGKTVTVRLTDAQAERLTEWLANARLLDQRLKQLEDLNNDVTERILAAVGPPRR